MPHFRRYARRGSMSPERRMAAYGAIEPSRLASPSACCCRVAGGFSPPVAPRSLREPLGSYGSRVLDLIGVAGQTFSCPLGLATQPLELAARPAECGGSLEAA